MYFTKDHDWIDFRGTCAYVGVSNFKLIGFGEMHEVIFNDPINFKKKGEVIAWIRYKDYKIELCMPINGTVVQINKIFSNKDRKSIADHLEKSGWIFTVLPSKPYDRYDLIPLTEYLAMIKALYPK
jgi:glycine cleavage system H protein